MAARIMLNRGLAVRSALAGILSAVPAARMNAQAADMPGMHHHAATSISSAAQREIDSVASAMSALATTAAATSSGFRPRFGWIPTMGTHWVSMNRMMNGRQTDRMAPSQLMFSRIAGRDSLVGIAYAYVTADNDTVRPSLFDGSPAWHEHPDLAPPGVTLVMLHVWFVPSPDGPFAGTNPNLPFWAAGLAAPNPKRMRDARFSALVRRASLAIADVVDSTAIFPLLKDQPAVARAVAARRDSARALIPTLRSAQRTGDASRWERAAEKAAAQWDAMYAVYLSSARTSEDRERVERIVALLLGEHHE